MNEKQYLKNTLIDNANDDEIDLVELFVKLFSKRRLILKLTFLFVVLALLISLLKPKYYETNAQFFLNEAKDSSLGQYASLLGIQQDDTASIMLAFFKSDLLKREVSSHFARELIEPKVLKKISQKTEVLHKKNISLNKDQVLSSLKLDVIADILKLEDHISLSKQKSGFQITYKSKDAKLGLQVVQAYLESIKNFITKEELTFQKKLFVLVEPPTLQLFKKKPNIKLFAVLGAFVGFFLSCVGILLWDWFVGMKQAYQEKSQDLLA